MSVAFLLPAFESFIMLIEIFLLPCDNLCLLFMKLCIIFAIEKHML